jgi:hypothetical protein
MVKNIMFFSVMVVLGCLFAATGAALASGRSPGIRLADVTVIARCEDREGVEQILVRALVDGGRVLTTRIGAAQGEVPLAQIQKITFSGSGISDASEDDFVPAVVELGGERQEQRVRVRNDKKDVLLTGHSSIGLELTIPLSACKSVSFTPLTEGAAEEDRLPTEVPLQ